MVQILGSTSIAVADSGADIFEVIETDKDSPENFQWIIRGCYDRVTIEEDCCESILLRVKLSQSGGSRSGGDSSQPTTPRPKAKRYDGQRRLGARD